jgi:hypothetical protein
MPARIKADSLLFRSSPPGHPSTDRLWRSANYYPVAHELRPWPKDEAIAAATLQQFVFLGCWDKPGNDDQG